VTTLPPQPATRTNAVSQAKRIERTEFLRLISAQRYSLEGRLANGARRPTRGRHAPGRNSWARLGDDGRNTATEAAMKPTRIQSPARNAQSERTQVLPPEASTADPLAKTTPATRLPETRPAWPRAEPFKSIPNGPAPWIPFPSASTPVPPTVTPQSPRPQPSPDTSRLPPIVLKLIAIAISAGVLYAGQWIVGYVNLWREAHNGTRGDVRSEVQTTLTARANDPDNRSLVCLGPASRARVEHLDVTVVSGDGRRGRARALVHSTCTRPGSASTEVYAGLAFDYERDVRVFTMSDVVAYAPMSIGNGARGELGGLDSDGSTPEHAYGFELHAGDTVWFRVRGTVADAHAGTRRPVALALLRGSSTVAEANGDSGEALLSYVVPTNDLYVLYVGSDEENQTGSFELESGFGTPR
jgi:hypothetical protein